MILFLGMVQLVVSMLCYSPDRHLDTNQVVSVDTPLVLEQLWIKLKVLTLQSGASLMTLMNMYSEEKVLTSSLLEDLPFNIHQDQDLYFKNWVLLMSLVMKTLVLSPIIIKLSLVNCINSKKLNLAKRSLMVIV